MCVAVPTLFDRFIGYSVLVSQLSSLCSFARTAHTHNTNTQSTHGHIHRFACLLAYTTTTYLGCCFLGPELFAPVVNRSITINIFNVLFRCLFIKTLLFLSWYRRGAALRCSFPKFYTIFLSLSLFMAFFHLIFLSLLHSSFLLIWIINSRIKLKSFFINIRFLWPFTELICGSHTHSHTLTERGKERGRPRYEHCSNLHLWSHSNTTNAFARIQRRRVQKRRELCINVDIWRQNDKIAQNWESSHGGSVCVYCWRWWTILPSLHFRHSHSFHSTIR